MTRPGQPAKMEENGAGGFEMKQQFPVQVRVTTKIDQAGQQEHFTFTEAGQLVELANGQRYLRYVEHQAGVATPVHLRLGDDLQLTRSGAIKTRLTFTSEQTTTSRYRTPYGVILLTVTTDELVQDLDWPQRGRVQLRYHLQAGDQAVGRYQLELQFEA